VSDVTVSLEVPHEIHTTRLLDAPPALVWRVFTNPEHIARWWGPDGFTITTRAHDLRVGGGWTHTLHGPDGTDWPNFVRFTAVEPGAHLAWDHGTDEGGPVMFRVSVSLEATADGFTRLTLRHVFPTGAARDENIARANSVEGAKQTTGRLAAYLQGLASR
jgi:uncharacterized protein YndB with AHSA1/START domain